ncbi:heterodisulfide reductase-related iron-sulfur binding cluster, partial [Vibrio cholerae]|uniref:heterodisulfide reductase-related iron-sulfur binding cluster n=1 Tax=Vibrio cholerae TaxID=666 RepID=UPI00209C7A74
HTTLGVHAHTPVPNSSHGTVRRWFKHNCTSQPLYQRHVAYFHGCSVNYNHPQLGKEIVREMNAMNKGVRVLDSQKCCCV